MTAFVFPGQGSQKPGMGKDLCEKYPLAKKTYDEADEILGFSISELSFNGEASELTKTENAQPAIFTYSAAVTRILKAEGITPAIAAGHSLGELSAVFASGMLDFETSIRMVRKRGEIMAEEAAKGGGAMAAVLALSDDVVKSVCAEVSKTDLVEAVNFNTPGQVVISGTVDGVKIAGEKLKEAGAKRVLPLAVSGAFHSALMKGAAEKFGEYLSTIDFNPPICPVVSNVTAKAYDENGVREHLMKQLMSPVLWVESVRYLQSQGTSQITECGFGSVVSGMVKKIDSEIKILPWESLLD